MLSRRTRITFGILLAAALVLPTVAVLAWWGWSRALDPLDVIPPPPAGVRVVGDSVYDVVTASGEPRRFRDIALATDQVDTIHVTVSLPVESTSPLSLVFILAGLRTGRESLAVVPTHGNAVLVGFEYPYDPRDWEGGRPTREAVRIRRAILNVPAQVVAAFRYMKTWPEVDAGRSALLGYSFGALFVPPTQRLAMRHDVAFDALVLAYAGVDLGALIRTNMRIEPRWVRAVLSELAATAVHAMEPARHLPHLDGQFLVIRGTHDTRIPAALSERLAALTPEPKQNITLEAGHMGPDAPDVTEQVVRITQDWLERIDLVER
jgi:dienelactone hydrolase